MPLHCLHLLQLLDVNVFAPLKRTLSKKTNTLNQYNSNCISRIFWVEMYIRVWIKVLSSENLKAGWKKTGLIPLNPDKIFNKLLKRTNLILNWPETLPNEVDLDFSLFNSFPPNGIQLCEANKLLVFALNEIAGLFDSVRQYTAWLAMMAEFTYAELIIVRKELELAKKILSTWKKCTKGKRVALEGKFVFFMQEVLDIARVTEAETEAKKRRKRPRKRAINEILDEKEIEVVETESQLSDSDCIVVARRM